MYVVLRSGGGWAFIICEDPPEDIIDGFEPQAQKWGSNYQDFSISTGPSLVTRSTYVFSVQNICYFRNLHSSVTVYGMLCKQISVSHGIALERSV